MSLLKQNSHFFHCIVLNPLLPVDKVTVYQSVLHVDLLKSRVKLGTGHFSCRCGAEAGLHQLFGRRALWSEDKGSLIRAFHLHFLI